MHVGTDVEETLQLSGSYCKDKKTILQYFNANNESLMSICLLASQCSQLSQASDSIQDQQIHKTYFWPTRPKEIQSNHPLLTALFDVTNHNTTMEFGNNLMQ